MLMSLFFLIMALTIKSEMFISSAFTINSLTLSVSSISLPILSLVVYMGNCSSNNKDKINFFFFMYLISVMCVISFVCSSIFIFIIAVEASIYPMLKLMVEMSKDEDKYSSMMFMFLINISGSMGLFYFMSFAMTNNMIISTNLQEINIYYSLELLLMLYFSFMMLTKVPMFMFQFWLGKAHVSSAGACSIILASLMLKLGGFGLIKFSPMFIQVYSFVMNNFYSINLVGSLIFCLLMIRFTDMKNLIAYSSVVHMTMIVPFILANSKLGLICSMFMIIGHGIISGLLFFYITVIYEINMSRSMEFNKGIESTNKTSSMLLFLLVFMNLGIPPLISFYSEMLYLCMVGKMSNIMSFLILATMSVSILFCMMMVINSLFSKKNLIIMKEFNMSSMMMSFKLVVTMFLTPLLLS